MRIAFAVVTTRPLPKSFVDIKLFRVRINTIPSEELAFEMVERVKIIIGMGRTWNSWKILIESVTRHCEQFLESDPRDIFDLFDEAGWTKAGFDFYRNMRIYSTIEWSFGVEIGHEDKKRRNTL